MSVAKLEKRLVDVAGKDAVTTDEAGRLVFAASSAEHVAAVVKLCTKTGTRLTCGRSRDRQADVVLDLHQLDDVAEYAPADMTIRVQAGMTMKRLRDVMAEHHQRLPLDPPNADDRTVGQIVGDDESGPLRFGWGTLRGMVIGMTLVTADGVVVRSGGRVVKNVAGYDLHKLCIGSRGRLAVIVEVGFKLKPIPESTRVCAITGESAGQIESTLDAIIHGPTRPTILDVANAAAAPAEVNKKPFSVIVGFEGNRKAVAWQCQTLAESFGDRCVALDESGSTSVLAHFRDWQPDGTGRSFRATMFSSHTAEFIERCTEQNIAALGRAGDGVISGGCDSELTEERLASLRAISAKDGGRFTSGGDQPKPSPLYERVRAAFDPVGIFA